MLASMYCIVPSGVGVAILSSKKLRSIITNYVFIYERIITAGFKVEGGHIRIFSITRQKKEKRINSKTFMMTSNMILMKLRKLATLSYVRTGIGMIETFGERRQNETRRH